MRAPCEGLPSLGFFKQFGHFEIHCPLLDKCQTLVQVKQALGGCAGAEFLASARAMALPLTNSVDTPMSMFDMPLNGTIGRFHLPQKGSQFFLCHQLSPIPGYS